MIALWQMNDDGVDIPYDIVEQCEETPLENDTVENRKLLMGLLLIFRGMTEQERQEAIKKMLPSVLY